MTAQILDGTATAKAIKGELTDPRRRPARAGRGPRARHRPGRRRPGLAVVRQRQAQGLRRGRHHLDPRGPARRPRPRPRSRSTSTGSTPTRRAPATSCSCRCPGTWTSNAVLGRMDPAKDVDGLHPTNLGWLVLGKDGAAALHAVRHRRAAAPPRRARSRAPRSSWSAAGSPSAARSGCCSPGAARTPRSRCATPAPATSPRTCAPPTSWSPRPGCPASSPATWSSPARRSSTSGVSRVDGKIAGDVRPGRVRRGGLGLAEPRRRRPDDPGDAAVQHRVRRRAVARALSRTRVRPRTRSSGRRPSAG